MDLSPINVSSVAIAFRFLKSTIVDVSNGPNVVLLEDHPLYREGLKAYLLSNFPTMNLLYAGGSFYEAKEIVASTTPDLAIVDLHLGDSRQPSEIVSLFTSQSIPVLVISALNNFESVKSAFSMGALGFVSKDSSIDDIGKAVNSVLSGKEWISQVLHRVLNESSGVAEKLSEQERKAVILYSSGLKLEVVAKRMQVAPSTAKQYIDRAKEKFRASGIPVSTKTDMYKVLRDLNLIN